MLDDDRQLVGWRRLLGRSEPIEADARGAGPEAAVRFIGLLDAGTLIRPWIVGLRDVLLGTIRSEVPDLPVFDVCEHSAHEFQVALP